MHHNMAQDRLELSPVLENGRATQKDVKLKRIFRQTRRSCIKKGRLSQVTQVVAHSVRE